MKKIIIWVTLLLVTLCFPSCRENSQKLVLQTACGGTIEVESGQINTQMDIVFHHPEVLDSGRYSCKLTMENNKVVVHKLDNFEPLFVEMFDNGYFVGIKLGEWDGWVRYYPYHTNLTDEDSMIVAQEGCCGIIPDPDDRHKGYIITNGGEYGNGNGKVYGLTLENLERKWQWYLIGSIEGSPTAYHYLQDKKQLLIATTKAIISLSEENDQIEVIANLDYLRMEPTSIVLLDNKVWCGLSAGFLTYDLSTHEETWYFIDWNTVSN